MKANEIHNMSSEERRVEVERLRRHLYDLRTQAAVSKLESPKQLLNTRRDIARILTAQRAHEISLTQQS